MGKVRKEVERALLRHGAIALEWGNKRRHGYVKIKTKNGLIINYVFSNSKKVDGRTWENTETFLKKINRKGK